MTARISFPVFAALLLLLTGCPPETEDPVTEIEPIEQDPIAFTTADEVLAAYPEADAVAMIEPVGDGEVRGYVLFQEVEDGVQVSVNLEGLEPGARGFHIHERGSCEPGPDGEPAGAAGPHFDPYDRPHSGRHDSPEERHVGDFGNLHVDDDGTVHVTFTDQVAQLFDETGIVARAVVVHAGEDDLETQPAGDAGPRIGCGVIITRDG